MKFSSVIVHFTNGDNYEINNVTEQGGDESFKFLVMHTGTRYEFMKRNITFVERRR